MMLSPAVRTSVMPACNFASSTSTTPPHLAPALSHDRPRSPISSPRRFSRRRFSSQSSSANSTNRIASGSPRRNGIDRRAEHGDVARKPEHGAVDQLHRDRPERDDVLRRQHRLVEAAEMAGADRAAGKQRRKLQLDLGGESERALGADQKMCEIDVVSSRNERIEIIAADAALHFRKPPLDLARLARGNGKQVAHQRLRHVDAGVADSPEMRVRAVGQNGVDRKDILARIAVAQRARAAGIIADHAADGGARCRRYIDRKPQAGRFELAIEFVEHDARLDRATAISGVERDDAIEMPRAIDDQRFVDRLSGLRCAAAARRHRHAFGPANRDRPFGFFDRARDHDTERHDLIMRCVRGIPPTRKRVEADLAHLCRLEPPFKPRQEPRCHVIPSAISPNCHHPRTRMIQ